MECVFDLEQPLIIPTNNNYQKRGNFKLVVDSESLDWYNARLSLYFKLTKLTGANVVCKHVPSCFRLYVSMSHHALGYISLTM